mgnify:CR=1 FL=1
MKFLFVGNRRFVLEEIIKSNVKITKVLVIKNSYLENDIIKMNVDFEVIDSKKELIRQIEINDFDVLVSNGCPYILPISKLKNKTYVNIHPSYLPDLKGVDPCIGALLFNRDSGATCHLMNDQIDSGDIISRVKIPYSRDLDISLLYQLSFIAESKAFSMALKRNFKPIKVRNYSSDLIYYTRKPNDRIINFEDSNLVIINKVKAFNNASQGCVFKVNDIDFIVYEATILRNKFLINLSKSFEDRTIIFNYEDSIVFKKDNEVMKFFKVLGSVNKLKQGDKI